MRNLIGIETKFRVLGIDGSVSGVVVKDEKDRVYVRGQNGKISRIPKVKICMFEPQEEPEEYIPFLLLFCENQTLGCPGVQYVQAGEGFRPEDCEIFMKQCPRACSGCRRGSRGELRGIASSTLKEMFDGMMFGEFPKAEKE